MNNFGVLNKQPSILLCQIDNTIIGRGTLNYSGSNMKGHDKNSTWIIDLLPIYFYLNNVAFDPYYVQYTIYCPKGCLVKNQTNQIASRYTIGHYYANYPWTTSQYSTVTTGTYKIVWDFKQYYNSEFESRISQFNLYHIRAEKCVAPFVQGGYDPLNRQSGTGNTYGYGVGTIVNFY